MHTIALRRWRAACARLAALFLASLVLCHSAVAQPASDLRLDDIVKRGELRVGSTGDYPPFSARVGGQFIGIDIELAQDLAQALGVQLRIVPTSWSALMTDYGTGQFDLAIGGISVTATRQQQAAFSIAYWHDGKTALTRCENLSHYQTLHQINQSHVKLIANPGGTNEAFARAKAPQAQLTIYPNNVTIFEQIVAGAADLMITDAIEARLQQTLHPQLCAVHPDTPFEPSEKAILLPRDPQLIAFVNRWLQHLIASGAVQNRVDRWLGFPWGLEPLRRAIDQRLLLAQAVARAKWTTHAPIEDLPREALVIEAAVRQGDALALPRAWIESVFRAQIEASKTVQRELYASWKAQPPSPLEAVPNLATTIRPELDRLTTQILTAMANHRQLLRDPARQADVARAMLPLEAASLSPAAASEALAPFLTPP